jgi:hypothetical protein
MSFLFTKRIEVSKNSIFYSLIKTNDNQILGFARRHYKPERFIKKVVLNDKFDIIEDNNTSFRGEDPRCFTHKNKIYVLDNFVSDMYFIDYELMKHTRIYISGKNISFIDHQDTLYFIHHMKPFQMYYLDVNNGSCTKVATGNNQTNNNDEYRGGTPGYKVAGKENEYYGYGHRTYIANGIMTHDVFKWVVTFPPGQPPIIHYFEVEQPPNSKNICDPTSVIEINGKTYLITAETTEPWFCEQDYITNVYEILE